MTDEPSAPPPYVNPDVDQNLLKNSLGINNVKFKELVGKSYTQTLLYLNLTIKIIAEQLKNNSEDDTLQTLQHQCQSAINIIKINDNLKKTLGINNEVDTKTNESSITIAELLLEIAGLGIAVAAGGKRSSKRRSSKRRERKTRRYRN